MEQRTLGSSGLSGSAIGFGGWTIGDDWWGHIPDADARRLIAEALACGITFFDTAPGYGNGRSERLLGETLAHARHQVVLATKFGYDLGTTNREGHRERPQIWDPATIRASLEDSLRRLRTDVIDLLQLHNPKMDAIQRDDIFATLNDLQTAGKIRAYGVALGPRIGWREEGLMAVGTRRIATLHMIYNLLEQDPGRAFIDAAQQTDTALLVRVPLSSGLLAGAYTADTTFDANDHRSHRSRAWLLEGLAKVQQLRFLTEHTGRSLARASLRFILDQPAIASVFPTFRTAEEIRDYAQAADDPPLGDALHARLAALDAIGFGLPVAATP